MKTAINYLKAELRSLKSCQMSISSTELKMEYAGRIDAIEKAIKHLRQVGKKCKWVHGDNVIYNTDCDELIDKRNGLFKFCPYCGREIKEKIGK